jgi:hypothetical protein
MKLFSSLRVISCEPKSYVVVVKISPSDGLLVLSAFSHFAT